MGSFLSRLGVIGIVFGLTLGSAIPAFAAQGSIGAQMSLRANEHGNRVERLLLRTEEHAKDVTKAKDEEEVKVKPKAQTGSSLEEHASNGKLMSGLRMELNTFSSWFKTQLRDASKGIAALSLQARAQLFADILTKIHSALLSLRTDISATISAAVSAGSSSSSSSSSS